MTTASNADQIAYWNADAGQRWKAFTDQTDALFAPMAAAAIDHARPRAGDRVLDIGCGCGATTLALAARVGAAGRVTGLDVSRVMQDVAAQRVRARALTNVELILGDASVVDLPEHAYDLLFSQFGVMFFADPAATFGHLRNALKPSGRLTFSCWRPTPQNPWFAIPAAAAKPHLPPGPPPNPEGPGPLSFADPDRVRKILTAAGFTGIEIVPCDTPLKLGADLDAAVTLVSRVGIAARGLETAEAAARSAATAAIRDALRETLTPAGVVLTSGTWLVSAKSGA